jgi:uncharacterized membrane protein
MNSESNTKTSISNLYTPRISKSWHKHFTEELSNNSSAKQGWALFSYGGWANDGQILVYDLGDKVKIEYASPGLRTTMLNELKTKTTKVDLTPLEKYSTLKSIDETVFDSLNYEYVHINKSKNEATHIFMRAGRFEKYPAHSKLIGFLNKFKKDFRK